MRKPEVSLGGESFPSQTNLRQIFDLIERHPLKCQRLVRLCWEKFQNQLEENVNKVYSLKESQGLIPGEPKVTELWHKKPT